MTLIETRIADFKNRLDEMDILECVNIEHQVKNPNRVNIEVKNHKLLPSNIVNSAVMGLISHFTNRKWCKDWSYMYIMKSHHSVTFTEESD